MNLHTTLTIFGQAHEESSGIGSLGIDPWAILAQMLTFLVLFWVIKKFALDKIVATLEKRRKTIEDGVKLGHEMEAEKEKLSETVEKNLQTARLEADKIIASAKEESVGIIKDAEAAATRKADAVLADARGKIDEDIAIARQGLEREMRELVAEATEVIIDEKLDVDKDAKLLDKALRSSR